MGSRAGKNCVDLWSELDVADQQQDKQVEVFYRRRKPNKPPQDFVPSGFRKQLDLGGDENRPRVSLAAPVVPIKRISWNRFLSTRGRTSIAIGACVDYQTHVQKPKRRGKPPPAPKGNILQPPNFEKERVYFEEVDTFELLEESPSPKNFATWVAGNQTDVPIPHLSSRLEKWLFSKKSNYTFRPSSTLSKLLKTPSSLSLHSIQGNPPLSLHPIQGSPSMSLEPIVGDDLHPSDLKTPKKSYEKVNFSLFSAESKHDLSLVDQSVLEKDIIRSNKTNVKSDGAGNESFADIETSVKKLSLAPTSASLSYDELDPFAALLAVCGQSSPAKLLDVFSKYCGPKRIFKLGEGTFGEAFMAGNYVCKIVPVDGELRVNGEVQKRSEELLEEVVLSRTLNSLKGQEGNAHNICTTFIETTDLKVCQGPYDSELIKAWEDWDEEHGSENDHPKAFPEKQRYVVFVLEHGGKDLESFVLLNFDEARTLLVQVTAGLAVAEAAYEFEHRDLHWGNLLLSRNDYVQLQFVLEGKQIFVKTFGLSVSIIDFTLSRMNTGDDILFLDLSSDPYLFKGPKGDKQAETYRKMKEVTEDYWEGSFPRTNVLWLLYLVDILLLKKSFDRTSKDERELRYLKKRLDKYQSAKEAISDPFFCDLFVPHIV